MRRIKIDPSLADPDEIEILEDLVVAACNDAKAKIEATCRTRWASSPAACPCRPGSSCRSDGLAGRDRAAGPAAGAAAGPRAALGPARGAGDAEAPRDADAAAGRGAGSLRRARSRPCAVCGNLDTVEPCAICRDPRARRRPALRRGRRSRICGPWSAAGIFAGRYHVLGGTLSALDGIGPEELGIDRLLRRVAGAGHRRGDPGAGGHGRRPDHRPLSGRAPAAARLHGHPARPRRAGRRRAHLPRRGHPRRRACARASGSLDRPAPSPLPHGQLFTICGRAQASMALLEILQAPHPLLKTRAQPVDAGRRRLCAGSRPTCSRRCTRPRASASPRRRSASPSGWSCSTSPRATSARPMVLVNPEIVWRSERA